VGSVPKQEPGVRPARAVPYELFVRVNDNSSGKLSMRFVNTGDAGANFLVFEAQSADAPRTYTVEAGKRLVDQLPVNADGSYDFTVHGPNGFLRRFAGKQVAQHFWNSHDRANPEVAEGYDVANGNLQLRLKNEGNTRCQFKIVNAYDSGKALTHTVRGGDSDTVNLDLRHVYGWYDLTITVDSDASFTRRFAGHVETGKPSMSDPALGGV
jgi:phospholipase C